MDLLNSLIHTGSWGPLRKPPGELVIDWSHPFTYGLKVCLPFDHGVNPARNIAVPNQTPTINQSVTTNYIVFGQGGTCYYNNLSLDRYIDLEAGGVPILSGNASVLAVATRLADTASTGIGRVQTIMTTRNDGEANYTELSLGNYFGGDADKNKARWGGVGVAEEDKAMWVDGIQYPSGMSFSLANRRWYSIACTIRGTPAGSNYTLLAHRPDSFALNGCLALYMAWDYEIPPAMASYISAHPYTFIHSKNEFAFSFPPVVGVGSTTYTRTTTLDSAIQKQNILKTTTLDAALQKVITATTTLDAALQKGLTKTTTLDAAIQKAIEATTTLDAALQKQDITLTTTLDGHLIVEGVTTLTTTLDAVLQKLITTTTTLDAVIQKQGITKTTILDAHLILRGLLTTTLDAILSKQVLLTTTLDAHITLPPGQWGVISAGTDGWVVVPAGASTWV